MVVVVAPLEGIIPKCDRRPLPSSPDGSDDSEDADSRSNAVQPGLGPPLTRSAVRGRRRASSRLVGRADSTATPATRLRMPDALCKHFISLLFSIFCLFFSPF